MRSDSRLMKDLKKSQINESISYWKNIIKMDQNYSTDLVIYQNSKVIFHNYKILKLIWHLNKSNIQGYLE